MTFYYYYYIYKINNSGIVAYYSEITCQALPNLNRYARFSISVLLKALHSFNKIDDSLVL